LANKYGCQEQFLFLIGYCWPSSFRGEDVLTLANQKQDLLLAAMFVGRMEPNEEAL
jgi:hypothetical protein